MGNERVTVDVRNIEKEVANMTKVIMKHVFIMKGIEKYIEVGRWEWSECIICLGHDKLCGLLEMYP